MITANEFVDLALTQAGDDYEFGAEASPSDPDPDAFDCSELLEWVGRRLGVSPRFPDGSWNQAAHCKANGTLVTTARALTTRGALLFRFSSSPFTGSRPSSAHVAISLGDGRTMEARSAHTNPEVGVFAGAASRGWTHAALIPGVDYSAGLPAGQVATYTVRRGDTLRAIADRFELEGWRELYDANRSVIGANPDVIHPGQVLTIPGAHVHTVAAGETLAKIGTRYGVPWRAIYDANRSVIGADPDLIRPGQVLQIPRA